MKRILTLTMALILTVITFGCGEESSKTVMLTTSQETGDLWGWVIDGNTDLYLSGAEVSCGGLIDISSDSMSFKGRYGFENIPSGNQIITVKLTGYDSYSAYVDVEADESTFHKIKLYTSNTGPIKLEQNSEINGETVTGDKLYYFNTMQGSGCSAAKVAIFISNSSSDGIDLSVNLPSTGEYPSGNLYSADFYADTASWDESITITGDSTPPIENGKYYIRVHKNGDGGTFSIKAFNSFSCK